MLSMCVMATIERLASEMRRFSEALRAGEFTGDAADEIEAFAARVVAARDADRETRRDMLAQAALDAQRGGNETTSHAFMAASHMVS